MSDVSYRIFEKPQVSFFIFASPKSGTTWMQRLLSFHPEAHCAASRPFGDYYHPNPLSDPHITTERYVKNISRHFSPAVERLQGTNQEFYDAVLFNYLDSLAATTSKYLDKPVYGEKFTPYKDTAQHTIAVMHRYHPGLKFVNLTRDGRDVVVSGAAQWLNLRLKAATTEEEKSRWTTALTKRTIIDEDFENFVSLWSDAVHAGLQAESLFKNYLALKYETFLAEPIKEATRLFQFLEIDSSDAVVASCVEKASFEKLSGGRTRGAEDQNSFFRKGISGDWKNWFTTDQSRSFAERAGTLLTQSGYISHDRS